MDLGLCEREGGVGVAAEASLPSVKALSER